jgi:acyl dehydratase
MNSCLLQPGQHLPPHRVIARNGATRSDNGIHADDVARSHGFRGGLVPGITTFAYMTRPAADALGRDWLERGHASIRLLKPIYEGEPIVSAGCVSKVDGQSISLDLVVRGDDGEPRATGTASVLASPPEPDLSAFPRAALPAARPVASRAALSALAVLGHIELVFDTHSARQSEIDDDAPLYRDAAVAHPARVLGWANEILAANVKLGPWIHLASEVDLCGCIHHGDLVSIRGRVDRLSEKKSREIVDLDVLVVKNEERPVMRVRHTAIYRL